MSYAINLTCDALGDVISMQITGAVDDSSWALDVPFSCIKYFLKILPECENLYSIKGQHIRVVVDVDTIVALKHSTKEITYYID